MLVFQRFLVTTTRNSAKIPSHRTEIRASNLFVMAPMLARVDPGLDQRTDKTGDACPGYRLARCEEVAEAKGI